MSGWQAAGRSVCGFSHRRQGQPAQDAIVWRRQGDALALAVADGHGSAPSVRSAVGAQLAVDTAVAQLLYSAAADADPAADPDFPHRLVEGWRAAVREHLDSHPLLPAPEGPDVWLRYGTTLLAALVTPRRLSYVQLGDGDILLVSPTGRVRRPWRRDQRLLGVETTSLCQSEAWREMRVGAQQLDGDAPALVLLCTDGYSNSFRTERGFLRVGRDILALVRTHGLRQVETDLETWLNEVSQLGSGDDVTAGFLYCGEGAEAVTESAAAART